MITLSVLTPFVPSRLGKLGLLIAELERQIGGLPVEHLYLGDNKRRTVGAKRNALLHAAKGKYIAFVDDDDWIKPTYIRDILRALNKAPDVVTFEQDAYFDGVHGKVEWRLGQHNEEWSPERLTRRGAWHPCVWRTEIARMSVFADVNWGEDWAWAEPLNLLPLKEVHLSKVLHEYHYDTELSEAHQETQSE